MNTIGNVVVCVRLMVLACQQELWATQWMQGGLRPGLGLGDKPDVRSAVLVAAPSVPRLHMRSVRHPQPRLGRVILVLLRAAGLPENLPRMCHGAQLIASCEFLCTFTSCRRSSPSVSSSLRAVGRCPSCPLIRTLALS